MRRRGFLASAVLGLGTLVWRLPGRAWAASARLRKLAVRLDAAPALRTVGGWAVLKVKGRELLFVRRAEAELRVLDAICTHEHCGLAYAAERGRIECTCHGSAFDLEGKVLAGPAPTPLTAYPARLDLGRDRVIVSLEDPQ